MYSMLFGNNSGGGANALLDGAPFLAELTHSLVPTRGTGSPTFTRATTATVRDNEGVLRTAIAGEARFEGARRVRNLTKTNSEDFGVAFTTVNGGNSASGTTLTFAGGLNTYILQSNNTEIIAGRTYCYSVYLKAGTKAGTIKFGNQTNGEFSAPITPTATLTRYQFTNISAGPGFVGFVNPTADTGTVIAERFQIEDVTGQSVQTAGEYVSVGVESAPYYHGSFVDGVKCFPTDLAGNPLTTMLGYLAEGARTNLCLQSNAFTTTWTGTGTPAAAQNVVGPDGATSAWTLTDNDAGAVEGVFQSITLTAAAYTYSVFVKKTTGAQASYPVMYAYTGATIAICTIDTSNGVATAWSSYSGFTMLAGLSARCASYNNTFWRVELTYTGTAAAYIHALFPAAVATPMYAGPTLDLTAQGSAVFYGAQVELGSFASSYIATTTIAVARNADVLTYPSAGNIDGTVGWCYAGVTSNAPNSEQAVYLAGTGAGGYVAYHDSDGALKLFDASAARSLIAEPHPVTTPTSIAVSWGGSSSQGAVNGTVGSAQGFDGDISLAGANLGVGCNAAGVGQIFGNIGPIYIGQRQLSASELQAVTA